MFEALAKHCNTVRPKRYVTSQRILNKYDVPEVPTPWKLSAMEAAVLTMLCEGLCQQRIATKLQCSSKSIHTYSQRARAKMGEKVTLMRAVVLMDRFLRGEVVQ